MNKIIVVLLTITFSAGILCAQVGHNEIIKIENALAQLPNISNDSPKKLLVFSLSKGYKHQAIDYADKMLQIMADKTGAFDVEFSKDMQIFNETDLDAFDGILFNNTTDLEFSEEQRKSLLDFIKNGKGIIGIHAATDNFKNWPDALEMMGGVFDGHPWGSSGTWAVKNTDPEHIINKSFNGRDFRVSDEIYRVKPFNLRKNSRVLLALDMKDKTNLAADGVLATDKDIPISWIRKFGKGRLFYCSFGHNADIYWNEQILAHYLSGIRFALGEIDAETEPLPFDAKSQINPDELRNYLDQSKDYEYGQSKAIQNNITAYLRYSAGSDLIVNAENQFIGFLKSDASLAAKQFICEQLSIYGTTKSLPALSELLNKDETFEMAVFAIDRIGSEDAVPVLVNALDKGSAVQQIAIINALSKVGSEEVNKVLLKYVDNKNENVSTAAINALALSCNPEFIQTLQLESDDSGVEKKYAVYDALLKCASTKSSNEKDSALKIYNRLISSGNPYNVRFAAFQGIVMLADHPEKLIYEKINGSNEDDRRIAIQLVNSLDKKADLSSIASLLFSLPEIEQVQLLAAFKGKNNSALTRVIEKALQSKNAAVRESALKSLVENADKNSVKVLAEFCAQADGDEKEISRETLSLIDGAGIDQEIIKLIPESAGKIKNELIIAAGQRQISEAADVVFNETVNPDPLLRKSAYGTLAVIGKQELLNGLFQNLLESDDESQNQEIEKAIVAIAVRSDVEETSQVILKKFSLAKKNLTFNSFFSIMSQIANEEFLPAIRLGLKNPENEIKTSAVRAISGWPNIEVLDDLYNLSNSNNKIYHTLAFRGYLRIIQQDNFFPDSEKNAHMRKIAETAKDNSDFQLLLSNLSKSSDLNALKMASLYLEKPQLEESAIVSVIAIGEKLQGPPDEEAVMIMEKISKKTDDQNIVKKSTDLLKKWREKNN
ncbi:MAG: ThuA domain-containing protein [Calditrichae bacterium]|nr:ThuA domain-containing protein [Calditrichia bacterium]